MKALGQFGPALRIMVLSIVVLGLVYPLTMTGVSQIVFPSQANGSLVRVNGQDRGSALIGQSFTGSSRYFQSRPSAAGDHGYDPLSTSTSNLALDSDELAGEVKLRRSAAARRDGVAPAAVAPDALLASGSGLDPHISPDYARQQISRVAHTRGLTSSVVRRLVEAHTQGRTLGFLGEPRVNVLELNIALDRASDHASDVTSAH